MRILSGLLVIIGLLVLLAGAYYLFTNYIAINQLHAVAYANKSNEGLNPNANLLIQSALLAGGGFLTGLGLSMPKR